MKLIYRLTFGIIMILFSIFSFSQEQEQFRTLETSHNEVFDVSFSRFGKVIAVADHKVIKMYETETAKLIKELKYGHTDAVLSVDFSKDSTLLVSGGKDSVVVIWDLKTNAIARMLKYNGAVTSVCISPDSRYVAYGGEGKKMNVYDLQTRKIINTYTDFSKDITSIAFSPDGQYIAVASGDKKIRICKDSSLIATLTGHKDWVRNVTFNSDGSKLLSCGDDGKMVLWDISDMASPKKQKSWQNGYNWMLSADIHENSKVYTFADHKGNVEIIDAKGKYVIELKSLVSKVMFIPGKHAYFEVAVATKGKGVLFINATDMTLVN